MIKKKKSKRILFVTNFYNPYNGMGKFIIDLAKVLRKKNFTVIILTGITDDNKKRIERKDGTILIRSQISFRFSRGYFSWYLIRDYMNLQKKIDYIYFHFPLVEILPLSLLSRKNKILHYHCLPAFILKDYKFVIANIFFSFSIFFSMFFCNKIITFTNDYFFGNFTNFLFRKKTIEIFPFVKFEEKNIESDKFIIEDNEKPIIGFLGRMCEEKGLEEIVKTSSILDKQNVEHEMILAGDTEDPRFQHNIKKILSLSENLKSITFTGKLSDRDKENFYKKIHILILPSTNSFEAFGLVQLEAMSYGKLVVASNLKGVRMPVNLTNNGYITKIKDPISLSENIIKCIELAKKKKQKDVFQAAKKYFDYEFCIEKYLNIFTNK
tara:strand:- start:78 stop:1220 length:1143 start_codon:yes stop_codon:yes gene_type:complete